MEIAIIYCTKIYSVLSKVCTFTINLSGIFFILYEVIGKPEITTVRPSTYNVLSWLFVLLKVTLHRVTQFTPIMQMMKLRHKCGWACPSSVSGEAVEP